MSVSAGCVSSGPSVAIDTGARLLTVSAESVFKNPVNFGKSYAIVADGHVQLLKLIDSEYFGDDDKYATVYIYEFLFKDLITGKFAKHSSTAGYKDMGGSLSTCAVYEVENETLFRFDEFSAPFLATHRVKQLTIEEKRRNFYERNGAGGEFAAKGLYY
jgi:hypothetical protein